MANINISDLRPAGAELFLDSESFINELTDEELKLTKGGSWWIVALAVACYTAGYMHGTANCP